MRPPNTLYFFSDSSPVCSVCAKNFLDAQPASSIFNNIVNNICTSINDGTGTRNSSYGYSEFDIRVPEISQKMCLRQVKQGFSSFCANFLLYSMIFQSSSAVPLVYSTLRNHQIWPKIWQKMKKSLVRLAFNPFLHGTAGNQYPGFRSPFRH